MSRSTGKNSRKQQAVSTQVTVLRAVKWILAVCVVLFVFRMNAQGKESKAAFTDVAAAVTEAADLRPMLPGDNQMVKRLYGIDPSEYDGILLYYPSTNMGAEEVLLVKLTDLSQQAAVQEAVEARVAGQHQNFKGYALEPDALLDKSITEVRGNYILFVCAEDPEPVRQAFLKAI